MTLTNRGSISRNTDAAVSKSCVILSLGFKNCFPKFGVLTAFNLDVIKVRKSTNTKYIAW